jgi:hypothetical protein
MTVQATAVEPDVFYAAFRGEFKGVMSWNDLDRFWDAVRGRAADGWFLYAVGEAIPLTTATAEQVNRFVEEIDTLLRRDHEEDYCGIVYTDSTSEPTMIKIFDPHNLGSQCGFSDDPPLPGWVMSRLPPTDLRETRALPGNRKRWWQRMWA